MNEKPDRIIFDARVSDRKILMVPCRSIEFTPYNPPTRTKDGKRLSALIQSIERHGLVYPLSITSDRRLIDGNRRLTACMALGMDEVECIVSPIDRDALFGEVNANQLPLSGKGWLHVGRGGGRLPKGVSEQYQELLSLLGTYGIDQLISQNVGMNVLLLAKSARAQGLAMPLAQIISRIAAGKLTNKVNAIIRADMSAVDKAARLNELLSVAP